jgi:hypothetical protein
MPIFHLASLMLSSALIAQGDIPASEVSIGGVAVGDSPSQVTKKLGEPGSKVQASDYLDLHYKYPNMTVSFSAGVVAGLFTDSPSACTPKDLCPGDSLDRMRSLYGEPLVTDRETGRFYEYYGHDLYCWFKIPVKDDTVDSITVACQP